MDGVLMYNSFSGDYVIDGRFYGLGTIVILIIVIAILISKKVSMKVYIPLIVFTVIFALLIFFNRSFANFYGKISDLIIAVQTFTSLNTTT